MEYNNKESRRKFLDKGIKIGLATVVGGVGLSKLGSNLLAKPNPAPGHSMELMAADGSIIQVDSSEVEEVQRNLVMRYPILWIETEKNELN